MTTPLWVENLNVNFNGTFSDGVVLDVDGSDKVVALWDPMSAEVQAVMEALVNEYAGAITNPTKGYQVVNVGGAKTGASATGLANDGTVYTTTVSVDSGAAQPISVVGSSAQTYAALLTQIQNDLTGATVSLTSGNLRVTSNTVGNESTIDMTAGNLFTTLTDYASVASPVDGQHLAFAAAAGNAVANFGGTVVGSNATGLSNNSAAGGYQVVNFGGNVTGGGATGLANSATTYKAAVFVDGAAINISVVGSSAQTFTNLVTQINTDLGGAATAAIADGNIVITSATTGSTSTVDIRDVGSLFSACSGFVSIDAAVQGTSVVAYTAVVTVDGTPVNVSVNGTAAQTFTALVSQINTDLGAAATAAITDGNIVITSATTGNSSSVDVADNSLFRSCNGFVSLDETHPGVADFLTALRNNKGPNGMAVYDYVAPYIRNVGSKPALRNDARKVAVYFADGQWKYFATDGAVGSTPPAN